MWETTKIFTEVRSIFNMSEDALTLYFELIRRIRKYSNKILLIFDNQNALEQCFYRSRGQAEYSIKEGDKARLTIEGYEYEFQIIERIYKKDWLKGREYCSIRFVDAYEKINRKDV